MTYLSTSEAVVVEASNENNEHVHEIDPEYEQGGVGFRWTKYQYNLILTGIKNYAKPKIILRNLDIGTTVRFGARLV